VLEWTVLRSPGELLGKCLVGVFHLDSGTLTLYLNHFQLHFATLDAKNSYFIPDKLSSSYLSEIQPHSVSMENHLAINKVAGQD